MVNLTVQRINELKKEVDIEKGADVVRKNTIVEDCVSNNKFNDQSSDIEKLKKSLNFKNKENEELGEQIASL